MMLVVPRGQLRNKPANGVQNGIKGIAISSDDHPSGEGAGAFLAKCVKALIDDNSRVSLAGTSTLHRLRDARVDIVGNRFGELALQSGRRTEVMKQVGMGAPNLRRDRFQGYCLRSLVEQ